jgi:SAM-dependent methyltransferase
VRFNWPLYAAALVVMVAGGCGAALADAQSVQIVSLSLAAGAAWFLISSLTASHIVYDRSDLHEGAWLDRALPKLPANLAICHCGYDEISSLIAEKLPRCKVTVLDHFENATTSEPSIRRARRYQRSTTSKHVPPFAWPVADAAFDAILGVLGIHELRSHVARTEWFAEARRCVAPGGRVVIVEHLRDFANFAAFGPGFIHFHSFAAWRRAWENAALRLADEFRMTPFVRVFVLTRDD